MSRHMRSWELPFADAPRGICRLCGKPVPKRRSTWCSQACVDEYLIRSNAGVARAAVWKRDKGCCQICGLDMRPLVAEMKKIERFWRTKFRIANVNSGDGTRKQIRQAQQQWLRQHGHQLPVHLYEADHIRPVVEGGGGCGLDNLRLLCCRCHRRETAKLAARLARQRRRAGRLFEGQLPETRP